MPKTIKGIYHNLRESTYTASNGEVVFYFSSKLYLKKFMEEYQENRNKFNKKLERFADEEMICMNMLTDIGLYERIEKRGFHATLMRDRLVSTLTKKHLYQYALRKMMNNNSFDWVERID